MKVNFNRNFVLLLVVILLVSSFYVPIAANAADYSVASIGNGDSSYINNDYFGSYIKNNDGTVRAESGELSSHGNTIRWQIVLVSSGVYAIRSEIDGNYLGITSGNVTLTDIGLGAIPNHCKWNFYNALGGGFLIQNVATETYLYGGRPVITDIESISNYGTVGYMRAVWRIIGTDDYGDDSTYYYLELPDGYGFNNMQLFSGETVSPQKYSGYDYVLWDEPNDFFYTGYDTDYLDLNTVTGEFSGVSTTETYQGTITATHKVTGKVITFDVLLNPTAVTFGVIDSDSSHDHTTALSNIQEYLEDIGYTSITNNTGDFTTTEITWALRNSNTNNIFAFRGHGGALYNYDEEVEFTYIVLNSPENEYDMIYYRSIDSITMVSLSNMKLVLFIGCETGAGDVLDNNLPAAAVTSGAEAAIGFKLAVHCNDANIWTELFFEYMAQGYTVYDACDEIMNYTLFEDISINFITICGNGNVTLFNN